MQEQHHKKRIGIIGYGQLGRYLVSSILQREDVELAFVWNRNKNSISDIEQTYILDTLDEFATRFPDLVVEVSHPSITARHAAKILQVCDYMVGSPTALSDKSVELTLKQAAVKHGVYIPSGAMWGAEDIRKMADRGILQNVSVTMSFHPESLKLIGELVNFQKDNTKEKVHLYKGAVRQLCQLAPNNVNTMAAAAIAAHNLGFDGVEGCLISDATLSDYHVVEIHVDGKPNAVTGLGVHIQTVRRNPATKGQVTGSATLAAFLSSLLGAGGRGAGIHLC